MAEAALATPQAQPSSAETTPSPISAEEYMERYAHEGYEWVRGVVIKMAPITLRHDAITGCLRNLLEAYFTLNPIGRVLGQPFVMRLDVTESRREPDLQIILKTNPGQLTDTAMIGPADICIEVVSSESTARDYGDKFAEYEKAGVREYWIVDPVRQECRFYRLNEQGIYLTALPDQEGFYQTAILPGLRLHVPTLWQEKLPDIIAVVQAVQAMLAKS